MRAGDLMTVGNEDYVFADPGEFYVIIPREEEVQLRLPGVQGKFMVDWYDRANGGPLQKGSKAFVLGGASSITKKNRRRQGPSSVGLGSPPETGSDEWAILVRRAESNDIRVEAESFTSQRNIDARQWCRGDETAYAAIIPDTRLTHDDKLIRGENFTNKAGQVAVASYEVDFAMPGRYYVWVRSFSRGNEDNSVHVGLNGEWPASGQRIQFCPGRNQWYWDNRQRTIDDHCGVIGGIWIDVPSAGRHTVEFSMREDGFVMDAFYLTLSSEMPDILREENEQPARMKKGDPK
jgi:hypothetical protein